MKEYEDKAGCSEAVEKLIENTLRNLHSIVKTNTIIGEPVHSPSGITIIPVSKVSVGFVVGGGEYADVSIRKKISAYPLAGASGGGMTIVPIGFLVEKMGEISFINIENKDAYQTILNLFNKLVNKLCEKGANDEK